MVLFSLVFFFFLPFLICFFFITCNRTHNTNQQPLPPQPWKLPFLGHLHHLFSSSVLPHQALANLSQKLGPIIHLQLGEFTTVVISSPELAKQVMKTHDLCFADRPNLVAAEIMGYNYTDIVFAPYGDYWRQMRKICILELLSAKKVKSFESIRDQETWNVINSMVETGPVMVNVTEKIFGMMNVMASRVVVGSNQPMLLGVVGEFIAVSSGFDVCDLFPSMKLLHGVAGSRRKLIKIRGKFDELLDRIIADHQECRQTEQNEDLLDVLLRLKEEGGLQFPLTYDNIKAVILDMLAAGTDTSSVITEWVMFELMINPRVMHKLQAEVRRVIKGKKQVFESDMKELDYLRQVIKETLRLHPPVPLLVPRECRERCEIGGYNILVNTKVITNVWKIGRDPNYWSDPESFIPERFSGSSIDFKGTDFEFIPFGAGRRICPGFTMGLANVELLFVRLLYHFNWELPNGVRVENLDRSENLGATLRRKNDLYLIPAPYNINSD